MVYDDDGRGSASNFSNQFLHYLSQRISTASLEIYTIIIGKAKEAIKLIKTETGWDNKYGGIATELNTLELSLDDMTREIQSFSRMIIKQYDSIVRQLQIVSMIFSDAANGELTNEQKNSIKFAIQRLNNALKEIDKIEEKTKNNLNMMNKITELKKSVMDEKMMLNLQGKVRVADHLYKHKWKYAAGAGVAGAAMAGAGAAYVVATEGLLGAAGSCFLFGCCVPPLAAIAVPAVLGGLLAFGLVTGVIFLVRRYVDNSVKYDADRLDKLEQKADELKSSIENIHLNEFKQVLNETNEHHKLTVQDLEDCLIDSYACRMMAKDNVVAEAINCCKLVQDNLKGFLKT